MYIWEVKAFRPRLPPWEYQLIVFFFFFFFIVLGFNNTSTPVGHFVSSPRERIVEEMKRGKGKKEEQEWK